MDKIILVEYQRFLISNKFVSEKEAPFCAYWVSKFLSFSKKQENLPFNLKTQKFFYYLNSLKIDDWKMKQAALAIQLYAEHYIKGKIPSGRYSSSEDSSECAYITQKMREAIRLKHYSYSTERSYLDWTRRFYNYISDVKNRNIFRETLNSQDVTDYLTYLAINERVSSSTQNQAFNALLFLFQNVLRLDIKDLNKTVRAKRGPKLPVVLSVEEVKELFSRVEGKNLLMLQLLYGAGLRLMEVVRLRVKDIDFSSDLVFVRSGKGDKDRTTMLPKMIKDRLRLYLKEVEELHAKDIKASCGEVYLPGDLTRKYPHAGREWGWQYVFPAFKLSLDPRSGKVRRHHISPSLIQKVVKNAVRKAGIVKHATVHTLRHSFATHLLMNGVNIREIQDLLGHKNIETTMVYTHVMRDMSNVPESPLDNFVEYSKV